MEINDFTAGLKPGGLFNTTQIRILICYILDKTGEAVPCQRLQEVFHFEGLANYFAIYDAVCTLEKKGHIRKSEDDPNSFVITEQGHEVAEVMGDSLPVTVRESALRAANKMLIRLKNERNNFVEVREKNGKITVTCRIMEAVNELMSVSIAVSSLSQADEVKEHFMSDPSAVYAGVIEALIGVKTGYVPDKK